MTNERAIDQLKAILSDYRDDIRNVPSLVKDDVDGLNYAIAALERDRWIRVDERLPEREEYVLVRYQNNDMTVACIFDRDECMTFWRAQTDEGWCCDCDTEPTHWMPLPEPPKEET